MCQKDNAVDTEIPKTTRLVTKTQYYSDKQGLEKNIEDLDKRKPNTIGLVKNTSYNTKIAENEKKIRKKLLLLLSIKNYID